MVGVVLYTLVEFLNFYLAYKVIFGIQFTKRKELYVIVCLVACGIQMVVLHLVDGSWRDIVATVMGLFAGVVLSESRKRKIVLLYPIVFFLTGFINIIGSYGIALLFGITQESVTDSIIMTLLAECTAIIILFIVSIIKKRKSEELKFTPGQYLILLVGGFCFFVIIGFAQGVLREEMEVLNRMKNIAALASVTVGLFFIILSVWQQITWKKVLRYQMENERYEMFLAGQEEHIRMLIIEDEKRRKLRHDMNAHMLALDTMIKGEAWEDVKEYIQHMRENLREVCVNKYTMISAVDAIVDEWHTRALQNNAEWSWEGTLESAEGVSIFEWCILFSNLLSNAVEAMEKLDGNKRIEVRISNYQEKVVLSIRNTHKEVGVHRGKPQTTKEDTVWHGLGLKNVEDIIARHQGCIEYKNEAGWFQVNIVL